MNVSDSKLITPQLIRFLRQHFALDWQGIHGAPHWERVRKNGLLLSRDLRVRTDVIELFAFLHDAEREDDYGDPQHGPRAAELVRLINGEHIHLDNSGLDLLSEACIGHSTGNTKADLTVMVCWDADRLDLGRVGTRPSPQKLCTQAAKSEELIEWCYLKSLTKQSSKSVIRPLYS